MRPRRSEVAVVAAFAVAVLASACGSGSSTASSAGSTSTTAVSGTTTGSGPTSTGGPTGTPTCRAGQLQASRLATSAAAGHVVVTYGLRNTSSRTCTMFGYPGIQLVDAAGRPLPTQVSHGGSYTFTSATPVAVALPSGASASFFLGYSDVPSGNQPSCAPPARVDITPPGTTGTIAVTDRIAPCGNDAVTVSPVHAGTAPPP